MKLHLIGYASDIAANCRGAARGPIVLKNSEFLKTLPIKWETILEITDTQTDLSATSNVKALCEKLAKQTTKLTKQGKIFLTVGGDHSSAIGTWSGAENALDGDLGLIWIDAHMDAHTPITSKTKNIHGMPLATLLGYGDSGLTKIISENAKLKPENLVLIGIRSFEKEEAELLKKLGVKIYYMKDINEFGLLHILQEALEIVTQHTAGFGVSIDLDAIDPNDAPGVSIDAPNGIHAQDLLDNLSLIGSHPHFIGAEIAEFSPDKDIDQKTEKLIAELIKILF